MQDLSSQLEMFEVPSPCINVCESGPRGYCLGCYRSREERLYWQKLDDGTKRIIIKACMRRKRTALLRKAKTDNQKVNSAVFEQQTLFK